jgi:hypothetical protein
MLDLVLVMVQVTEMDSVKGIGINYEKISEYSSNVRVAGCT